MKWNGMKRTEQKQKRKENELERNENEMKEGINEWMNEPTNERMNVQHFKVFGPFDRF